MRPTSTDELPAFFEPPSTTSVLRSSIMHLTPAAARAAQATPDEALQDWMQRLAPTTRRSMQHWLRRFATWCVGQPDAIHQALEAVAAAGCRGAHAMARQWVQELATAGLASGSCATAAHALGAGIRALHEAGAIPFVLGRVAPRVEPRRDVRGPGRSKVVLLLEHLDALADAGDLAAARDAVAASLLHNAALRRAEVCAIRAESVQLSNGEQPAAVTTVRKGWKEPQRVVIDELSEGRIRRLLRLRGEGPGFLLLRLRDPDAEQPLSGEALRLALQRRARQLGLGIIRPHGLRHASASACLRRGSLAELQALGAWRSLSSAARYVDQDAGVRQQALRLVQA